MSKMNITYSSNSNDETFENVSEYTFEITQLI